MEPCRNDIVSATGSSASPTGSSTAVPHQLDDAALVLGDLGLDELGAMGTKVGERAFLVGAYEARVTDDVRAEDCGESALDFLRHGPPIARITASLIA